MGFTIGDRVMCTDEQDYNRNIIGVCGTVRGYDADDHNYVAVEFDKDVQGHTCDGRIEHGFGYYVEAPKLIIENTDDERHFIRR